jgi:hypothetical protein
MCASRGPAHLLLFDQPLAHDLVDGRLDEAGCDRLAVPVTICIVRDRSDVGRHIIHELFELGLHLLRSLGFSADIPRQILKCRQCPMRTAVPQVSFRAA